ncbi:MAG: DUF4249 family protein [Ignavibacteriales bacterium]|nr:MAG: DUF4249 family protein [Ignavibacteriales bacterium]
MRTKIYFWILTGLLLLSGLSCEENFSPKTEYKKTYILYCVESVDIYFHSFIPSVYLTKTYEYDSNFPAGKNQMPPFVSGAKVILRVDNKVDTLKELLTQGKYFGGIKYYGGINNRIGVNSKVTITAILPDSTVLTTNAVVPEMPAFETSYPFLHGFTTKFNQWRWGYTWKITWNEFDEALFFPKFLLRYYKANSPKNQLEIEIPMSYQKSGNKSVPIFPTYTRDNSIEYSFNAVDSVMKNISLGDTNKSSYIISDFAFQLTVYDKHLANFYSSTNGYLDPYSIRLDETVYTNVSGGMGLFGFKIEYGCGREVNKEYAESFGYRKYE